MKINKTKIEICLASACMNPMELCEKADISYQTYLRIVNHNKDCKTATVGKIAKALNSNVTEIIETRCTSYKYRKRCDQAYR